VIVAAVTLGIMIGALELADKMGWIPHRRFAMVWAPQNWPEGGSQPCHLIGDLETPLLRCGNGAVRRRMNVEFRGSLHATEWRCRQSAESLICTTR
jgi:hypothetical protein